MIAWLRDWWATARATRIAIRHANGESNVFRNISDELLAAIAAQDAPSMPKSEGELQLRAFILAARAERAERAGRLSGA